jgi:hypothetical protein|tara:strand:- start:42 stop:701 length:660 start_codon:yes stop_codon:yes gene_type:complete
LILGQDRVLIEGKAEYNFSDNETLIEAKSLCYNMALRNAVESYQIFVSSMVDVRNMQLRNDIIQTLSTGYLEDLTVVDERIDKNNNIIYYKLKAYIQPEPFNKALKQEVKRRSNFAKPSAINEGKYLTIISILEKDQIIKVVYKKKFGDDRIGNDRCDYQSNKGSECYSYVMIDYYDEDGIPINGDRRSTAKGLLAGEIRSASFQKQSGVKSYRVWVTK